MTTPWKFLVKLTSRRSSAKASDSSDGYDTDPEALERNVEHTSTLPTNSTQAVSQPGHAEDVSVDQVSAASDEAKVDDDIEEAEKPPLDFEEAQPAARLEADHSWDKTNSTAPTSTAGTKLPRKPATKGREGRKKARAAGQNTASKNDKSVKPPSSRDLFFHDVATLDEEIKMLRTQLARKLYLQNVQLKKMLERFETS
ncbi:MULTISPECIES: hypothetical protein [Sinorhizobium]|uniref:Uncharacterized protein n=1 Tax=Sinorhizobium americanum TaxID=194963 RepID=A0A2S3YQA7_9HYPH|nr:MULTISPECIES: hypothetical protein [Sinorhizobium]PDT33981.1 hypothetical protein CO656_27990 [Sinorhizobium sp. FG01]POH33137.1 hypothetical protein ATY31_11305 [Sinorhizobium americanum]